MVKTTVAVAGLLLVGCEHAAPPAATTAPAPGLSSPAQTGGWLRVLHGDLADVEVEHAAYDAGEPDHFQIRVRVRNLTARPIAIDLRARRPGIYVNQWQVSDIDHRDVIDEGRAMRAPLDAAGEAEVRAAMTAGALTMIPAGGALELYGSFNASGRAAVDAQHGRWLLLAVDGSVVITDGARIDDLRLGDDEASRIVAIAAPVAWKAVPAGARRLPD